MPTRGGLIMAFLVSTSHKEADMTKTTYIKRILYISIIALVLSMVSMSLTLAATTPEGRQDEIRMEKEAQIALNAAALKENPENISALNEITLAYDDIAQYAGNAGNLSAASRYAKLGNEYRHRVAHAVCNESLAKLQLVLDKYNESINENPKNATAWDGKADTYTEMSRAYDSYSVTPPSGTDYYGESKKCESEVWNIEHNVVEPDSPDVKLGKIRAGLLTEIESYNQSIAKNASDHLALYQRGQKYRELEHTLYCEFDGSADNETQKKQLEACNRSSNESQGYAKAALDSFQSSIKIAGSSTPLSYRFSEGLAYRDLNDWDNALKCFDKVVSLANGSPNSDQIYYIWGLYAKAVLLEFKDPNEAIKCYMSILQKDAYDYRMWDRLSRIYKRQGMYTEATEAKAEAKTLNAEVQSLGTLPKLPEV